MAVTQQLARVPGRDLDRYRSDVNLLENLVAYNALPKRDYLDLDWFPTYFRKLLDVAASDEILSAAFCEAVDGQEVLNKDFPEFLVDDAPSLVEPTRVKAINEILSSMNVKAILRHVPDNLDEVNVFFGSSFDEIPLSYFREYFKALVAFYSAASARDCGIILWWD